MTVSTISNIMSIQPFTMGLDLKLDVMRSGSSDFIERHRATLNSDKKCFLQNTVREFNACVKYSQAELFWYTFEPIKIHFWDVFDTSVFDTFSRHFIQFRYDFLSSIIIWYTFGCINVYLIHFWVYQNFVFNTLLSVSKLYKKWIKTRWPILISSKYVHQSSARASVEWSTSTKEIAGIRSLIFIVCLIFAHFCVLTLYGSLGMVVSCNFSTLLLLWVLHTGVSQKVLPPPRLSRPIIPHLTLLKSYSISRR